jgi:ectoine hydroxylase-related dioxygenase (phytanoyl-CoA dioxygenase family)
MTKSLSAAQIAQFETDGYLFPLDCMSAAEATDCRTRFEAFEREAGNSAHKVLRIKSHLIFPWLVEIARHPKILDAIEDLIGPNILAYLSSLWFKNANDPSYVSWHQDSAYYGLDPHDVVIMWFAFTDSTRANGCVRVLPGTHRDPDHRHDETYAADNLLSRGQSIPGIDETGAVDMELRAGQFSLHHERVVHGSRPNGTDDRRLGMSIVYVPSRVRSVVGRRSALLVRGTDAYGHWDRDPEPRFDLDPVCLEVMERWIRGYEDTAVTQEAERG